MSTPQMGHHGGKVRHRVRDNGAVALLKFTLVGVWPAWLALCLSSLFFTPAWALLTGADYSVVWFHTTLVTAVVFYLITAVLVIRYPHALRD